MSDIAPEPQAPAAQPAQGGAPTREEFDNLAQAYWESQAQLAAAAQYVNSLEASRGSTEAPVASQEDQEDDEDFDLDAFIEQRVQERVQEALGSNPTLVQLQEQRGLSIAEQYFQAFESKIGKFDHGLAYHIANSLQQSNPQLRPEQALAHGAAQAAQYTVAQRQQVAEAYQQNLQNRVQNAPLAEPPVASAATPTGPTTEQLAKRRMDYEDVLVNYRSRTEPRLSPN